MPTVPITVAVVRNVVVFSYVDIVIHVNVRTTVPVIPIGVTVIRMPVKAVVICIQIMVMPADRIRGCYSPEITVVEIVTRRIRVVIDRVRTRVVEIDRSRLINDDARWFVIGYVYNVFLYGRNANRAVLLRDKLVVIAFQITSGVGAIAKQLDC